MDIKDIKFNIVGIEVASKSLSLAKQQTPPGTSQDYAFNFLIDLKIVESQKVAIANTYIEIKDNSGAKLADLTTLCAFQFPDFDQVFTLIENNKYDVAFEVEAHLKAMGVSITRGILFSELRGTYLHGAILPLIDVRSIVARDREKHIEAQGK